MQEQKIALFVVAIAFLFARYERSSSYACQLASQLVSMQLVPLSDLERAIRVDLAASQLLSVGVRVRLCRSYVGQLLLLLSVCANCNCCFTTSYPNMHMHRSLLAEQVVFINSYWLLALTYVVQLHVKLYTSFSCRSMQAIFRNERAFRPLLQFPQKSFWKLDIFSFFLFLSYYTNIKAAVRLCRVQFFWHLVHNYVSFLIQCFNSPHTIVLDCANRCCEIN